VVGIQRHPSNVDTVEHFVQNALHPVAGGDYPCRVVREAGEDLDLVAACDQPARQNARKGGRPGLWVVELGQETDAHVLATFLAAIGHMVPVGHMVQTIVAIRFVCPTCRGILDQRR
jgi:hypothetical protein